MRNQTDHDPRAPAYVAAQGPLPSTLAHFWQMIWEQGAVVIVALCRLQENGEVACARYWPEEGAEVYHIYEVSRLELQLRSTTKTKLNSVRLRFTWLVSTSGVMITSYVLST